MLSKNAKSHMVKVLTNTRKASLELLSSCSTGFTNIKLLLLGLIAFSPLETVLVRT